MGFSQGRWPLPSQALGEAQVSRAADLERPSGGAGKNTSPLPTSPAGHRRACAPLPPLSLHPDSGTRQASPLMASAHETGMVTLQRDGGLGRAVASPGQ